jgi:1,4-alpha-glucan branching enzyme
MVKTYVMALLMVVASVLGVHAQVTTEPSPLQEDSQDVTIFFHADQGNKGLQGVGPETKVYAHTGVCLSNGGQWVNAPSWGDNSPKYELQYVSTNLWKLYIGDIREYYGITDPAVNVTKLAFVFRSADCKKEGKGEGNTDIFVDVVDAGLQVALESNLPGTLVTPSTAKVTFKVGATKESDITLSINGEVIGEALSAKTLVQEYTFSGPGNYEVKAVAKAGDDKAERVEMYCYASDSQQAGYPGGTPKMGPVKNSDGSVTFCLGAPGKSSVILVGEWNGYQVSNEHVMNYTDVDGMRYFWVTVKGLDNDRMYGYYFLVDGSKKVGDPYARLVLDPWNDKYLATDVFPGLPQYPDDKIQNVPIAIYQGSINDYDWKVENFKGVDSSDLIIYELLFRDFTGTEGKALGDGTVRGAIEKIPYLKKLGVNAIELLPIMEFNGNISWGYNPNFYFAPDKAYGTPDDYKEFIDICHQNGMAVILDMVFNQSDGLHPWYQMYQPGENPFYNLDAPHAYSVLNDWNQGYPMVQEQWADVLRYWMTEYKFDGFRFDLVKGLGDNDSYANSGDNATNSYNASRVARMRELQKVVEEINPNAYFINENLAGSKEENEMAATGQLNWANINNAGCQFAMGYSSESDMNRFYAPKDGGRLWGSTVSYLESHDEQRLAYKQNQWGVAEIKGKLEPSMARLGSAAAQMILAPGAHMIWQFSEIGNSQNTKNSDGGNNTDPKIVNWAQFEEAPCKGLYDSYCELIGIRNLNRELFAEDATFEINCGTSSWANGRTLVSKNGSTELYTVVNPNVDNQLTVMVNFDKSDNSFYHILSKSYGSEPSFSASSKTVTVPANCYVVIGSMDVSSVESVSDGIFSGLLRAYSVAGEIMVDSSPSRVVVYGADGRMAGSLEEGERLAVSPGVYVLRAAGETLKIVVR